MNRRSLVKALSLAGISAVLAPLACTRPTRTSALRRIELAELQIVASGLARPETVVVGRDGRLYASNANSACAIISADGTIQHVGGSVAGNGIALDPRGRVIIASFGLLDKRPGPLQRLDPANGRLEMLADTSEGHTLVASNFPVLAADGSIYCSHSTWGPDASAGIDPARADGFVFRVAPQGRVSRVIDGLPGPNGCCFDKGEAHLYVAQTAAGNIIRLARQADGSYAHPEPYGPSLGATPAGLKAADIYGRMTAEERSRLGHPDAIGFDAQGNLWVTLPFANRVVAITPDLEVIGVIDDPEGRILDLPTSLAWGGPDLGDLYFVSRRKGHIVKVRSPIPGAPLAHQRAA